MSESTILLLILVAIALVLVGVKNPVRVLMYVVLTWLVWQVFVEGNPTRAGMTLREGLRNVIAFVQAVI